MPAEATTGASPTVSELQRHVEELSDRLRAQQKEYNEALQREAAVSQILRVISSSPTDVQPTFDAIAASAARLCEAEFSAVARFEGGLLHLAATNSLSPEEAAAFYSLFPRPPSRNFALGRAFMDGCAVQLDDVLAEADYDPHTREVLQTKLGYRTIIAVPIFRGGMPIGAVTCGRRRVKPFSAAQIQVLNTFAEQAAIALDNVRLFTELRDRTEDLEESLEYQTATSDVLKVINRSTFDLQSVLDTLSVTAARLCLAEQAYLTRREGEEYRFVTAMGSTPETTGNAVRFKEDVLDHRTFRAGRESITGRVIAEAQVVQIVDVAADPEYAISEISTIGRIRTLLGVPMMREGAVIGTMSLGRERVEPFTERQIELVKTFADQAVIAIENARLLAETREALEQQTATAEVLQAINSSPGDLTPVFETILEKAHGLCRVAYGSLQLYDGMTFRAVAVHSLSGPLARRLRGGYIPGPNFRRLIDGADFAHVPDMAAIDDPMARAAVEGGIRTLLTVALRKDGKLLGQIVAARKEVLPFADKEIALLQSFATQAVIAIENARLINETREALKQQTATAEVLTVINSSPGDLTPVFDAILSKATHLCEAKFGVLWVYGDGLVRVAAHHNVPPIFAEFLTRASHPVCPANAHGRLMRGEAIVHIADVTADEAYSSGDPIRRALVELGGGRALLAVPLRKDETFLGDFVMYRKEVGPFSDKQIALLQNFATQAVIAIENARLINETREALKQQTATAEVLEVINASPGKLAPVFDAMLQKALTLCGADFGQLVTFDGVLFRAAAWRGYEPGPSATAPSPGMALYQLVHGEQIIHIPDITADDVYRSGNAVRRRLADEYGGRTAIWVALRKDAALLGAFVIYRTEVRPFSDKQIALLQNFAAQAVIAIENARLLDELRDRQAELRVTFDNMGDGVAMFDADQRLAAWNRNFQQIIGLSEERLARRPTYAEYLRLLAERGEFGTENVEAELASRLEDTKRELRLERTLADGTAIEVRRNAVPGGGVVLIYSDITERKRSEEQIRAARDVAETALKELKTAQASLIHAEKMASLGQLTAGIAHEIKNPLNFVNNFAGLSVELLDELKEAMVPMRETLDDERRTEIDETIELLNTNLDKIASHGRRADGIVKSMLLHSRGGSSDRQTVDINAVLEEAFNLAYHGARAQDQSFNVTLERDLHANIAPIEIVPQDVTRVLLNLIGNGFYAVEKRRRQEGEAFRPTVKVTTRDLPEAVEIAIRDNGVGIPTHHRQRLFQPFFTTKPTGEGTGLGLSISYDIVTQQHGGTITVDSEPGQFTEFRIRLPRRGQAAVAAGRPA